MTDFPDSAVALYQGGRRQRRRRVLGPVHRGRRLRRRLLRRIPGPQGDRRDAAAFPRYRLELPLGFLRSLERRATGYARYRFSYASGMPGARGQAGGVRGDLALHVPRRADRALCEVNFDRGMALAQQDFAAERIKKVLLKLADRQNASAGGEGASGAVRLGGRGCACPRLRRLPPCGKTAPFPAVICAFRRRAAVAQW